MLTDPVFKENEAKNPKIMNKMAERLSHDESYRTMLKETYSKKNL